MTLRPPLQQGLRRPLGRRLLTLGCVATMALCAEGWFAWHNRGQVQHAPLVSDMAMVLAVRDRVVAAGLIHAGKDCLAFFLHDAPPGQPVLLDVFEKHSAACPGDAAAPRLFGVRVDRSNSRMWDDAGMPKAFAPLP